VAEAEVVVATNWIDEEQYDQGVWLYYAMLVLYNLRGLYYLANHLDRTGQRAFGDLFAAAVEFFQRHTGDSEVCAYVEESVAGLGNYYLLNAGRLAHLTLHSDRAQFDALLREFVAEQDFWQDPENRAMFELDLLSRPYIYREKPVLPNHTFEQLTVEPQGDGFRVTAPRPVTELLAELDLSGQSLDGPLLLRHPSHRKMPYLSDRTLEENISYCQGMTLHLRSMLPEWTPQLPATVG